MSLDSSSPVGYTVHEVINIAPEMLDLAPVTKSKKVLPSWLPSGVEYFLAENVHADDRYWFAPAANAQKRLNPLTGKYTIECEVNENDIGCSPIVGTIVALRYGQTVAVGYSALNPKDRYRPDLAKQIAAGRALALLDGKKDEFDFLPLDRIKPSLKRVIDHICSPMFLKRLESYFGNKEGDAVISHWTDVLFPFPLEPKEDGSASLDW